MLSELEIEVDSCCQEKLLSLDVKLLENLRPIFQGLKKLILNDNSPTLNEIFKFYQNDIINSKTLTLNGLNFMDDWQNILPAGNQKVIMLHTCNLDSCKGLHIPIYGPGCCAFSKGSVTLDLVISKPYKVSSNQLTKLFPNVSGYSLRIRMEQDTDMDTMGFKFGNHLNFLADFENVIEIYVAGENHIRKVSDVYKVLEFVPNIKVFGIYQIQFHNLYQPPVECRRIFNSITEIIKKRKKRNDRIKVIVNLNQLMEFKVNKNVDKFMVFDVREAMQKPMSSSCASTQIIKDTPFFN